MDFYMKKRIKSINSPYMDLKGICEVAETSIDLNNLNGFNTGALIPKIIDDDSIGIYEYLIDGNLYLVDEDGITQVYPTHILFPEEYMEMEDEELFNKYDCVFCGEADDFTCYAYFEEVAK